MSGSSRDSEVGRFHGFSTESAIVVTDPATTADERGAQMGYLRSLPYLYEQGITNYTFPPHWLRRGSHKTFDEVFDEQATDEEGGLFEFTYRPLREYPFAYALIDADTSTDQITTPYLCQITSQSTNEHSSARTTHKIVQAYNAGQIDELFLVTDTESFTIAGTQADKPLTEELDSVRSLSYEKISQQQIKKEIGRPRLPFSQTRNLWLHRAAVEYEEIQGSPPSRVADLFEFDVLNPGIRTWDIFEFLATPFAEENPDHIDAVVRPWIESDITKVESHIRNALQEFDYDRDAVRHYRDRGDRPD